MVWPYFGTYPFLKKWTVVALIAELLLAIIHFLQTWKGINQMSESLRKIWSLNTCASGRWSSGEQADVGHSRLHTPHSTLNTPQREGRTLHRHLWPQTLRIAEMLLTLSKEAHLEFFENHFKPVLSYKHRQPWKGQTVPANPGKHRVRNTHLLNQHAITTIRDGSGYEMITYHYTKKLTLPTLF